MNEVFWLCCVIGLLPIIHSTKTENPGECMTEEPILHKYLPKIMPLPEKDGEPAEATYGDSYFICQNYDAKDQYISLFSKKHNMALFSAFIYEEEVRTGRGTRPTEWETTGDDFPPLTEFKHPVNSDYTVFSDFNRGHLFPHSFAKDEAQGKATMRLTNAVPQDAIFNKWIWKYSEDYLKTNFLNSCLGIDGEKKKKTNKKRLRNDDKTTGDVNVDSDGNENVAIVVTGAVPSFYGLNEKKENVKEDKLRIGMVDGLQKWTELFPVTKWDKAFANIAMRSRLTVPTHMWTYFICVKKDTDEILDQASYIGLNYRTGVVKWYDKFDDFTATLTKMYGSVFSFHTANPQPAPTGQSSSKRNFQFKNGHKIAKACLNGEELDMETMDCNTASSKPETDFWDNVNLHEMRKTNEKHRLIFQLALFGFDVKREGADYVMHFANSEAPPSTGAKSVDLEPRIQKQSDIDMDRSDRRKRSTSKDTSDIEMAVATLVIIDQDQDRDFVLKKCTILEKSCDGEIQEEHVYDLEHNTFIEDKKTDIGSSWTASLLENGEKVEATKKVSNIHTIDIILKPRD